MFPLKLKFPAGVLNKARERDGQHIIFDMSLWIGAMFAVL